MSRSNTLQGLEHVLLRCGVVSLAGILVALTSASKRLRVCLVVLLQRFQETLQRLEFAQSLFKLLLTTE